jgi:hypothetical protein
MQCGAEKKERPPTSAKSIESNGQPHNAQSFAGYSGYLILEYFPLLTLLDPERGGTTILGKNGNNIPTQSNIT